MPGTLVILAHPQLEQSRVAAALAIAAKAVATAAPALTSTPTQATTISVRDLCTLDLDYLVDVAAEQAALAEVDLLVWLHPVHWYGMPALG